MATATQQKCTICHLKPKSHCFIKISTHPINIYYSSIPRSSDFSNATAIQHHIVSTLEPNRDWIWIFDCKGLSSKHAVQIDVVKYLIKLMMDDKYAKYMMRFVAINMSATASKLLEMVLPFLPKEARDNIDKYSSSPIEIIGGLQKFGLNAETLKWVNKAVVLNVEEDLPEITGSATH